MTELLTTNEAADFLRYRPQTLVNQRNRGGGPPFIRLGYKSIRYSMQDLEAWLAAKRAESAE